MIRMHQRIVRFMWLTIGGALAIWAIHGLVTQPGSKNVAISWLMCLSFSLLAITAGITSLPGSLLGRVLTRVVSCLALLYTLVWLFFGGLEDAPSYAPVLLVMLVLSTY